MSSPPRSGTLGTFAGVFTPSILTILGIILFLRTGFVVGSGGLIQTFVIIAAASAVSVLTSLSLAAIATNIEVRGGGDYYLISRTLGLEFGGAIGIVLFIAQSVSVAFYAIGFGEVVTEVAGIDSRLATQAIALAAVLVLFGFAWAGADIATRFQFAVMVLLLAALISFYAGALPSFDGARLGDGLWRSPEALGFWGLFAIFFPAVTGFTQGVSMSGDLADPTRSLPRGTFVAVGLSTIVYVSVAVLLAATVDQSVLADDTGDAMRSVALFGPLVLFGVFAATLSSAMASLLGAPRILQSLAGDRVFSFLTPFARGHGAQSNPRVATVLSLAIAVMTLGLGRLDVIAPVVSMFFLISYGLLNYATYWEARAASPSFRPRFRWFDRRVSLAGTVACFVAMLAINIVAGAAALVVLYGVYRYLASRRSPERWADSVPAHQFRRAKEAIRALSREERHPRNWRPQIVAFSADPLRRERLVRFASWMEGDSGLTAVVHILEGEGIRMRQERDAQEEAIQRQMRALDVDAYGRVVLAADGIEALPVVVQSFGLGGIEANTALFGWPENPSLDHRAIFTRALREVSRLGVNVVVMASDEARWADMAESGASGRHIDVWWADDDSSRLALLTAYLCTRTRTWERAALRVLTTAPADEVDQVTDTLETLVDDARIPARIECLADAGEAEMVAASADATLVLLPMRIRGDDILLPSGNQLDPVVVELPLVAAVLAAEPVDLLAGPETGAHQELVQAEQALDEAEARLASLEQRIAAIDDDIGTELGRDPVDDARIEQLELERATVRRRILKAAARVEAALVERDALDERD